VWYSSIMISGLPRVVVTHWVHPEVVAYLRQFSDPAVPDVGGVWTHAQLVGQVGDAEALIACMADRVDDAFLDQCPRLRIVAATLKGYDNFDAAACARRGVWLTIVPDTIIPPTAELAVGLTLGITRRVGEADRVIRSDGYQGWRPRFYGSSLAGATTGIIGMGDLGQAIAGMLRAFGTRIVYADPRPLPPEAAREMAAARLDLDALVSTSDIIILTAPLTAGTAGLLGTATLPPSRTGCSSTRGPCSLHTSAPRSMTSAARCRSNPPAKSARPSTENDPPTR
jgi:phosphonate dehydrogenase